MKAGEIVGKLYDALRGQYLNPDSAESLASLNKLCVRLVFCLYAESSGIFGKHKIFRDWLEGSRNIRQDLILLFDVLNTPLADRDPYLDDTLKKFPFVNGGLFAGAIEISNQPDYFWSGLGIKPQSRNSPHRRYALHQPRKYP